MSDFETSNKDSLQKALEQTKPQADFAFRENLEAQLMAQLTSSEQVSGGNTMNLFKREKHKRKTQSARIPLTLAAAIIAIALVGGLLIFIQQADLPRMSMSDSACGYEGATRTVLLQEGDTLFSLAEQYEVDINELLEANCFEDQLVMSVGDEVLIPVSTVGQILNPITVFVATGDIVAGETITMEKVISEPRMPDRVDAENPVNAIENLLGQTALVSIEAGTIINSNMITAGQRTLMTPVVIAITDMVAWDEITADDVEVVMYPEQSTPGSTFSVVDDVIGSYATTDIFTHELILEAKVSSEPVDNQANFTSRRIGIVRGNIDVTNDEVCEDGLSPATITDDLAELTAGAMQRSGYLVEVFDADERALSGYEADFIIELYTGGCNEDAGNGYSGAWYSDTQYLSDDEQFEACMTEHYEPVTGIPSGNYPTSALPSSGTPLLGVGQSVPSVRLYLGSLAYNREALVDNAEMLHSGLVFTLRCMMPIETLDQVPVVVARYDLPLSHVITEEDIVTMMMPRDFAEELVTQSDNDFAQNLGDSGLIGAEEQVVGQVTTTYISQFEPILSGDILDANQCATNPNDEIRCRILEEDKVAVTLPIEDRSVMLLVEGQQVDVITATLSVDAGSISSQPTLLTLVSDARILMIDGEGDGILVTIEVEPQIAEQLVYFIESQHDLQIVPHIENSEAFNDQDIAIYPMTADGLVGVAIPLEQIGTEGVLETGYVSDVTIMVVDYEGLSPEAGELYAFGGSSWQIHQAPILYVGRGEGVYQNPYGNNRPFVVIGVQPIYVSTVTAHVQQGARFSLNNLQTLASTYEIEIVDVSGVGDRSTEVVTIRNNGRIVDMTNWTLEDSDGNVFTFGDLMLFADSEYQVFTIHGIDTPTAGYWGQGEAVFSSNETITLYDNEGRTQDIFTIP